MTRPAPQPRRSFWRRAARGLLLGVAVLGSSTVAAGPAVSVIIDDLGYRLANDREAIALPGAVTYAILPHTPYSTRLAELAYRKGSQVLLHLPMESTDERRLGPGGLTLHMTRSQFLRTLRDDIASIPHVSGVNNHMGSLLTRHPGHMAWLMGELHRDYPGLVFVDSRTTDKTVAEQMAAEYSVPNTRRNVFLDDEMAPEAIRRQFGRLVAHARTDGTAIAIGHPHPTTLAVLREMLPTLRAQGIALVPVSRLIAMQHRKGPKTWQASLSPSPPAAKSLKP